jgi:HEAT repeat protein
VSRATRFGGTTGGAPDAHARAADAATAGLHGPLDRRRARALASTAVDDPDPRARAAALAALVRAGSRRSAEQAWREAAGDPDPMVRRRAAELAPALVRPRLTGLAALAADSHWAVAETAAWAIGEISWSATNRRRAARALASLATGHPDPLVREAAVAAVGALGDPIALDAVLHGTRDRATVRRRAVLALAPFEGPEVEAALVAALHDPDWQVRQAAEDLL